MPVLPVLAGSYSGPDDPGIRDYALDTATGRLTQTWATSGVPYPAYLVQGPRPGWAYAVGETTSSTDVGLGTVSAQTGTPGSVWALRPAAAGVGHEPAGTRPSEGELPTHLSLHPGGRWLVVANYGAATIAGSVAVLPIGQDGSLGSVADLHRHEGSGPVEARQRCAHVHSTIFTPDGRHLIAADLGADALVTYRFDELDGRLRRAWTTPTPSGWGPRYLAWHPPTALLLAVGELACEVAAFEFEASTGRLRMETRAPTLLTQADGPVLAADIVLTAGGSRLLVSNRGARDSITTIEVRRDGGLAQLAEAPCGGAWPRDLDLTPDGRLAVVANEHSDALTVLRVDGDGVVGEEVESVPLPGASFVAIGSTSSEQSEGVHG